MPGPPSTTSTTSPWAAGRTIERLGLTPDQQTVPLRFGNGGQLRAQAGEWMAERRRRVGREALQGLDLVL
jgi:hypothetical protein